MSSKWERFKKEWEKSFAASAFAEAGEYKTAEEILGTNGWVVFVGQEKDVSENAISYVKNLCVSTKSALKIIWKDNIPSKILSQEKNIKYEIDIVSEDLSRVLPAYLRRLKKINLIILTPDFSKFKTLLNKITREFSCPVVFVANKK